MIFNMLIRLRVNGQDVQVKRLWVDVEGNQQSIHVREDPDDLPYVWNFLDDLEIVFPVKIGEDEGSG